MSAKLLRRSNMSSYSAFDIIGPMMVGPSSSHTAGAARLGRLVGTLCDYDVKSVVFRLHGSFAKTYRGHGTDRALMAGLLGMKQSDIRLKNSLKIAEEKGITYKFEPADFGEVHPNTVEFVVEKSNGEITRVKGSSVGGGEIKIIELNGLSIEFTGKLPTIITRHKDHPGVLAKVTAILAKHNLNIAYMSVYRHDKGKDAFMVVELDEITDKNIIDDIKESCNDIDAVYLCRL